ncbi:FtsX-like permease family protein [Rhodocytophaga rosea]|uniref:FtsX-like permease family protein n=1 Tax=Rhodocytophaga rosea TaxID=2704465 RepID=A0A6C0GS00_9BACT|nr:ABC transporter permease [Rhodocytophaga rosea]QHT70848.1 FtsX-like permease family protein [Rhodocytophaga rosea]
MIQNYLQISLRLLGRNKVFSSINIAGLSTGIAFCMLIFLFVRHEYSFDAFHEKADRIYRLQLTNLHALAKEKAEKKGLNNHNPKIGMFSSTFIHLPLPFGPALKEEIPEVEAFVRLSGENTAIIGNGNKPFKEVIHYTDANFFEFFSFELIQGQRQTALSQVSAVVISEKAAIKYFGKQNPIGQPLHITQQDEKKSFIVSAVAKDVPTNSSINFDILIRIEHLRGYNQYKNTMQGAGPITFLLLSPDVSLSSFSKKLQAFVDHHFTADSDMYRRIDKVPEHVRVLQSGFTPLTETHFDTSVQWPKVNNPLYAYILTALGLLILLVVCINYISLTLTSAASRLSEIGIRKVMGASRGQIIGQLWAESQLLVWMAVLLAIGLVYLFLPFFNAFTGKQLYFSLWQEPLLAGVLLLIALLVGIVAGGYPAVILSDFRPVNIIKGSRTYRINPWFSKILLLVQYSMCLFLVSSSLIMYNQMRYISEKDLGFDKEQVLILENFAGFESQSIQLVERFRQWASQYPSIVSVSSTSSTVNKPVMGFGMNINQKQTVIHGVFIDEYYLPTLGIELVEGKNFSPTIKSYQEGIIINETLANLLGRDSTGKVKPYMSGDKIIGVVKDFHYASLESEIAPLSFSYSKEWAYYIIVKMRPGKIIETIQAIEKTWKKLAPDQPFVYTFLDENLKDQYTIYRNWTGIVGTATVFAVITSCLGLFALSGLSAVNRTKEIGIRKVLGASVSQIFILLNQNMIRLTLRSFVMAVPIAWYVMSLWLQDFAYRISLSWELFAVAGLLGLCAAFFAVCFHSLKAANTNPVISLRNE